MSSLDSLDRQIAAAEAAVREADFELYRSTQRAKAYAGRWSGYGQTAIMALGAVILARLPFWAFRAMGHVPGVVGRAGRAGGSALVLRLLLPKILNAIRGAPDREPVLRRLSAGRAAAPALPAPPSPPPPRVSAMLEPLRFAGVWFVVAALDSTTRDRVGVIRDYTATAEGFDVVETRHREGHLPRRVQGVVRIADSANRPAEGSISFAPKWSRVLPALWSDHCALLIDRDYGFALVGDRSRTRLRVLSRTRDLDPQTLAMLLATARDDGYPVERIVHVSTH